MTPDELIAETLRLDGEATKGPWNHIDGDGSVWNADDMGRCIANTDHCPNEKMNINAEAIAHNRTAAPLLARMLRVAMNYISGDETKHADQCRAEIERIAKGKA